VVWSNGTRIVLPSVPGFSKVTVTGINAAGWISGYAGLVGTTTHAVVWKPNGSSYLAIDLGVLPGTDISTSVGIDDLGRAVGYSSTRSFPPTGAPFMWTESGGMVDLSGQGFPNIAPVSISTGGTVATATNWYRLGDPNSVVTVPPPPQGFYPPVGGVINDAGDQGLFLPTTTSQFLRYAFRLHHDGTWQQIGFTGNGTLLPSSLGSISAAGDITATDLGTGVVAFGPDGVEQSLSGLLSPAYSGTAVTTGGPMNAGGQVLAKMLIGASSRLVRLTPAQPCTTGCIKASVLQIKGKFINDPNDPGHCTVNAKNHVTVKVQINNEKGAKLAGVLVNARFLDDYWMNKQVSATTNSQGVASFVHDGLACVGTVAFLVDGASKGSRTLDRTAGVLTGSVIPLP
jgi:hypothetical protein